MTKKIYTTEKAKMLDEQIKALKKTIKECEEKNKEIYWKYDKMKGMYGKLASNPWDGGQYKYNSPEIEEKEKKEREQFLIDSGFHTNKEKINNCYLLIDTLKNEYYLEQFGITYDEKMKQDNIKRVEKRIKEIEKELEETKKYLEELKNE